MKGLNSKFTLIVCLVATGILSQSCVTEESTSGDFTEITSNFEAKHCTSTTEIEAGDMAVLIVNSSNVFYVKAQECFKDDSCNIKIFNFNTNEYLAAEENFHRSRLNRCFVCHSDEPDFAPGSRVKHNASTRTGNVLARCDKGQTVVKIDGEPEPIVFYRGSLTSLEESKSE